MVWTRVFIVARTFGQVWTPVFIAAPQTKGKCHFRPQAKKKSAFRAGAWACAGEGKIAIFDALTPNSMIF